LTLTWLTATAVSACVGPARIPAGSDLAPPAPVTTPEQRAADERVRTKLFNLQFHLFVPEGEGKGMEFDSRSVGDPTDYKIGGTEWGGEHMTREWLLGMERHSLRKLAERLARRRAREPRLEYADPVEKYLDVSRQLLMDQSIYMSFYKDFEIQATLKLVRGHRLNWDRFEAADLPWMIEFPHLKGLVDRKKEKYIYELGRGANEDDPDFLRFCAAMLVREAAADAAVRGGRLEDAFIYVHTVEEATAVHFTTHYPWRRWDVPGLPPGHAMLRANVADLFNHPEFRPHAMFKDLSLIVDTLRARQPSDALNFVARASRQQVQALQVARADGTHVEWARLVDRTRLMSLRARVTAAEHGIDWERVLELGQDELNGLNLFGRYPGDPAWVQDRALVSFRTGIEGAKSIRAADLSAVPAFYEAQYDDLRARAARLGLSPTQLGLPTPTEQKAIVDATRIEVENAWARSPHEGGQTGKDVVFETDGAHVRQLKSRLDYRLKHHPYPMERTRWVW
jgi:hypothetical protein